ncbi:hypothetical protein ACI3PL_30145, partial [Lacticaseibacillus paracasei]
MSQSPEMVKQAKKAMSTAKKEKLLTDVVGGESFGFLTPDGKFIDGRSHPIHDKLAEALGFSSANDMTT